MGSNARSEADVFQLRDRFADAWNRHDLDALMSMMSDDCVFDASAGPQVDGLRSEGKQAVRTGRTTAFTECELTGTRERMTGTIDTNKGTIEFVGKKREGIQQPDERFPQATRRDR